MVTPQEQEQPVHKSLIATGLRVLTTHRRIRLRLVMLNMNQTDLAKAIGCKRQNIAYYMNRARHGLSIENIIERFANALKVPTDALRQDGPLDPLLELPFHIAEVHDEDQE